MAAFFGFKKSLNTHCYEQGAVKLSKAFWWCLQKYIRKYKKINFPLFIDICDRFRTYRTRFGTYRDHLCRCL